MPYQIDWLVPERIILSQISDPFLLEDIGIIDQMMVDLLDESSSERIHLIIFDQNSSYIPLHMIAKLQYPRHAKLQWGVSIRSANPIMQLIVSFGAQFFGKQVRFVDSLEDALLFLQEIDLTLPNLEPYLSKKHLKI